MAADDAPSEAADQSAEQSPDPAALAAEVRDSLAALLYGQRELIDGLLAAVLAGGHVLLEGPPGVGKTLAARALARLLGGTFARIQCVPDLLPADVTGSSVYRRDSGTFEVRRGPLFANVVLADELNRTTPRTQSALLEAMAERQVTIDGGTLPLPQPHVVLATQNPLDAEGTYPLPLSQRDRFLFELRVGYPPPEREKELLLAAAAGPVGLEALPEMPAGDAGGPARWMAARSRVRFGVTLNDAAAEYILGLVRATRAHPDLEAGISPRGSLLLAQAARAAATLAGRTFVTPEDVRAVWLPVCRHRVQPIAEVEVEGFDPDALLASIAEEVEVPR